MSEPGEPREKLGPPCFCAEDVSTAESTLSESECWCRCPRDEHDIVIHQTNCVLFKNETFVFPEEICECNIGTREDIKKTGRDVCICNQPKKAEVRFSCDCDLLKDVRVEKHICKCFPPEGAKEAFVKWRQNRDTGSLPTVLESTHPLMQRFQLTLREFLLKENAIAEEEIMNLKEELRLSKRAYEKDLEDIYKNDHDCNAQRTLIEEYESTFAERAAARKDAEQRAKEALERQKEARAQLDEDLMTECEASEEMEALAALCQQLEKWREEMEADLTVSQHMSEKMRTEKRALADEKRQMDIMVFRLTNEVWKLDSKLEMLRKQMEIKTFELDKINDKVMAYGAEMEDLDLDKRRLVSLWNCVLNNISQRDKIFNTITEDYAQLQNNFHTLINNLEVTKTLITEELQKGKELEMNKDKIIYDTGKVTHLFHTEDQRRITLETEIGEVTESIDMIDKDQEMLKAENFKIHNILKSSEKEYDHKVNKKLKLENDVLANLQDCLLNNKAVESMANGIKNMRDMSRKQEIALMAMENQHAKLVLDLEAHRNRRCINENTLKETLAVVRQKETELNAMQAKYDNRVLIMMRKQRELDIIIQKYWTMKELFDSKTPQEVRIETLETQIKNMRERTYQMQHDWLRLQGHVVKLTEQFQKVITDVNLMNKQLQICEQKIMRIQAESEKVVRDKSHVERELREMRGRIQVLEKTRKDAHDRNNDAQRSNISITQEYAVNLKNAEMQIIELEDELESMDNEKVTLTQDLDRVQREALIWQRKGILAVELKKSMKEAKSTAGEIGKMRNEIHRMEKHREQIRRTAEKLAEDLAHCVKLREIAIDKSRAHAAVEKSQGQTSQSVYHHKLRLAKSDVVSATKQLNDAEMNLKQLLEEQKRFKIAIDEMKSRNRKLEEQIASLMSECRETDCQKHWLLERVVRTQRFGSELAIVVKRQSLKINKPKSLVMTQYSAACALNDRVKYIVERLAKEYPHFGDKLAIIVNTLDIHSPGGSPRLAESPSVCGPIKEMEQKTVKKPPCPR